MIEDGTSRAVDERLKRTSWQWALLLGQGVLLVVAIVCAVAAGHGAAGADVLNRELLHGQLRNAIYLHQLGSACLTFGLCVLVWVDFFVYGRFARAGVRLATCIGAIALCALSLRVCDASQAWWDENIIIVHGAESIEVLRLLDRGGFRSVAQGTDEFLIAPVDKAANARACTYLQAYGLDAHPKQP